MYEQVRPNNKSRDSQLIEFGLVDELSRTGSELWLIGTKLAR